MQILLCAATPFEIAPAAEFLAREHLPVRTVITGVGLMAATYAITRNIAAERPSLVIQAGISGTLDSSAALGTVVVVRSEMIGDLGVTEGGGFRSVFDLRLSNPDERPWQEGQLRNPHPHIRQSRLKPVRGVTVNEVTTDRGRIRYYRDVLGAEVESMEGAALHYVCLQEGIPFLQIRGLSNYVGERDKSGWLFQQSLAALNGELISIIQMYST